MLAPFHWIKRLFSVHINPESSLPAQQLVTQQAWGQPPAIIYLNKLPPIPTHGGNSTGEVLSSPAMGSETGDISSGSCESQGPIEHRTHARVGLLGNPSDVYYGRTISFSLGNFWASVRLEPSEDLVIKPHPHHDLVAFASIDHLVRISLVSPALLILVLKMRSLCCLMRN